MSASKIPSVVENADGRRSVEIAEGCPGEGMLFGLSVIR